MEIQKQTLYVVATPLGNLEDLSQRATQVLHQADFVACEDTRSSRKLLDKIGSQAPTIPYHEHNEKQTAAHLADKIEAGASAAMISDAGTPNISDPGFRLVRECRRRGINVVPVPGPCALVTALCASGLPTNAFFYAGFLPPKSAARKKFLEAHKDFTHSIVLYESCHRIVAFAEEMCEVLGNERTVCIARELTKLHETFLTGSAAEVCVRLKAGSQKGEFVVIIAPNDYTL